MRARLCHVRGWFMRVITRRSIRTKAPLTAAVLILIVVAVLSTASFLVLRETLHDHAGERLRTLAQQLGDTLRTNSATSHARAESVASRPEIAAYLASPSADREAAALQVLAYNGPQPELSIRTDLRDAAGRVLLTRPGD